MTSVCSDSSLSGQFSKVVSAISLRTTSLLVVYLLWYMCHSLDNTSLEHYRKKYMSALLYYFGHNSREVNYFLLAKLYLLYKFAHVKKLKINSLKYILYRDVRNMLQTEASAKFLDDQTKLNDIFGAMIEGQ